MDLFKEVFKFFTDRANSISSKFLVIFAIAISLAFVDNILGFSFFYNNEKSIEQLKTIQQLKKEYKGNHELIASLEIKEGQILNRKNIVESFGELFSKEDLKSPIDLNSRPFTDFYKYDLKDSTIDPWNEDIEDSIRDGGYTSDTSSHVPFKPNSRVNTVTNYRSKIWHTISSSFGLILLMILTPFIPFYQKKLDSSTIVGTVTVFIAIGLLILLNQYILGLIPVILNQPWINYSLNTVIHSLMILFFYKENKAIDNKSSEASLKF